MTAERELPAAGDGRPRYPIGVVAARTGVAVSTLRMWERRHGFPVAHRLAGGHRRYTGDDIDRIVAVERARLSGLSLPAAIERARRPPPSPSLYAGIRQLHPHLQPVGLGVDLLEAFSAAIEDESCARAEHGLLMGSFQHARAYRTAQRRWQALATGARLAVVFADFPRTRLTTSPVEVRVGRSDPLSREWAVVCLAPRHAAFVAGWEVPGAAAERRFETVWAADLAVVRDAVRILARALPEEAKAAVTPDVDAALIAVAPSTADQAVLGHAITTRLLHRLDRSASAGPSGAVPRATP